MIEFTGLRDTWRSGAALGDWRENDPSYEPEWWSIHWGGGGPYRQATPSEVASLLMSWWGWHTSPNHPSGGMTDIAYNYAAPPADDVSTYSMRLRGERRNGAQLDSNQWGPRTRTFVFYTGKSGGVATWPERNQLAAFAQLWAQDPLPVRYHRDFPRQGTQCPGDRLAAWAEGAGYWDYLTESPLQVIRVGGSNRYETAGRFAQFPLRADDVCVVSGEDWADGLTGGRGLPVLYVRREVIPDPTVAAVRAIRPGRLIVVGGTAVISETAVVLPLLQLMGSL